MRMGWEIKKLEDVCNIVNGSTPLRSNKVFWEGGEFPWFTIDDIRQQGRVIGYTRQKVTLAALEKLRVLPPETILLCCTASIGEHAITEIELTTNQQFNGLVIKDKMEVFPRYLFYFTATLKDTLLNLSGKTTIDFIAISKLKEVLIPLPPLPEQQHIVSILDKAFEAIDKAKANAEQNLKNAKELFESYLQGVFEKKGEGWGETILSDVATDITDGDHQPPPKSKSGIPFITISNINKESFEIDFSSTFKVPEEYFQKIKVNRKPKEGDLLYTVTGSYGIPVLINSNFEFCFQRHIALIRPKISVNSRWLFYWILSPQARRQANQVATGTAQRTVSLSALRSFIIPDIQRSNQDSIVHKLDALSAETNKLVTKYQIKVTYLEELKKSILQKAFNGELTSIKEPVL